MYSTRAGTYTIMTNTNSHVPASFNKKDAQINNIYASHSKISAVKAEQSDHIRDLVGYARNMEQACKNLIAELEMHEKLVKSTVLKPQLIDTRAFQTNLRMELKALQRVLRNTVEAEEDSANPDAGAESAPVLLSSNLPYYQAIWEVVKGSCTGLVALWVRFYWETGETDSEVQSEKGSSLAQKRPNKNKKTSALVDIVADDGLEWVKVSSMSEKRLLHEMAEKGWEDDADGLDDGETRTVLRNFDSENEDEDEDEDELELILLAKSMRKASNATRVRYQHPRLRIVLSRIKEGSPAIDAVLNQVRSYGVQVECREVVPGKTSTDFTHLLPQPFNHFTSTLNVDCTVLFAMVSDISHNDKLIPTPQWQYALVQQMKSEKQRPLMVRDLWPAIGDRELVSCKAAMLRFKSLVEIMGTDTEKKRARLLLGEEPYENFDQNALLREFQELSTFQVPMEWKLPIKVVEIPPLTDATKQKEVHALEQSQPDVSDLTKDVILYGWITGLTTITSNRTISKQIEDIVESNRTDDDTKGPEIWVCERSRSLVGKTKGEKAEPDES